MTDGVKLCVLRLVPKGTSRSDSVSEDSQLEVNLKEESKELQREIEELLCNEQPSQPITLLSRVHSGCYPISQLNFPDLYHHIEMLHPPIVGVDPGRKNLITFWQQGFTKEDHITVHHNLRGQPGYFLQPFGLRATAAYHQKGTPGYLRRLRALKLKRGYPKDLSGMTFKSADMERLKESFRIYVQHRPVLLSIFCDKKLAKARFNQYPLSQTYEKRLALALQIRFPDPNTIFIFGSADINGSRFKGAPPTSSKVVKKVIASCYRVVDCPEFYTSQKCHQCGSKLEKSKHPNKNGKEVKKQGQIICKEHGVMSRDQNSAMNFLKIFDHSLELGAYTRPAYLTKES